MVFFRSCSLNLAAVNDGTGSLVESTILGGGAGVPLRRRGGKKERDRRWLAVGSGVVGDEGGMNECGDGRRWADDAEGGWSGRIEGNFGLKDKAVAGVGPPDSRGSSGFQCQAEQRTSAAQVLAHCVSTRRYQPPLESRAETKYRGAWK